ncbi:hypothetical protein BJ912DRAFT_1060476 [Pholiota molesta]|nr:hypothetical protein BJ912DRAFT_1060476 [Pholiota molesta]
MASPLHLLPLSASLFLPGPTSPPLTCTAGALVQPLSPNKAISIIRPIVHTCNHSFSAHAHALLVAANTINAHQTINSPSSPSATHPRCPPSTTFIQQGNFCLSLSTAHISNCPFPSATPLLPSNATAISHSSRTTPVPQGLSKGVKITFGGSRLRPGKGRTKSTTANRTLAQIEKERVQHAYEISVLSWSDRQKLLFHGPEAADGVELVL